MSVPVRLWLEISHHAAFAVGGWAFVRADGAVLSGLAGGERRIDAETAALRGLIAALTPAPAAPLEIRTANPFLHALPARIAAAQAGDNPPIDNLALWAQAAAALPLIRIVRVPADPKSPTAFAAAWAELARDKAKAAGAFTAAIPKSNLAKAGV